MSRAILYIFVLIFISCQDQSRGNAEEEHKVLEDVFMEVVGSTAKMLSSPPPVIQNPAEINVPDSAFTKEELEIIRQRDLNRKEVKTDNISNIEIFDALYVPELDKERLSQYGFDSRWIGLLMELKDTISSTFLPVEQLEIGGPYNIIGINKLDRESFLEERKLIVQFSRVFFNEDMTRAFFFVNFYNRFGDIVFVEKRTGKWVVVNSKTIWIS